MDFVQGEEVIFAYPERSERDDTYRALESGNLRKGHSYKIWHISDKEICLIGHYNKWYVGVSCLEKLNGHKPKRNLPSWW